jgi:iron complex outermembrane receptor protein
MQIKIIVLVLFAAIVLNLTPTFSEEASMSSEGAESIQEEIRWLQAEAIITIATRHEIATSKAPGIITVITAEEIKNLGYRTFSEILRTVPGFEILKTGDYGTVIPAVRGVESANKVRVMFNGHLVNNPYLGDAFTNFDDFPVENIKRIEAIRGPGSAMYGENAFLAVINIITKDAEDIDGVRVSSGYGRFDTREGNIVFGNTRWNVGVSGMFHYRETNGYDGTVESDSVTTIDKALVLLGFPAASQTPGRVEDWRREFDLNLKMTYKDFYVEGLYINKNRGGFAGIQNALTDETDVENNYVFVEVGYKKPFGEKFTFKPRLYYDQFDDNYYTESFPEGVTIPLDINGDGIPDIFNTYPDGIIGNGKFSEKIVGTEIPLDYKIFDGNIFTLGLEYRLINQTNVHFFANFNPKTMDPLPSIQDFSDTLPFLKETTRRIWSVYLQDMWDITDTLNFTLGLRYDEYNDFGNSISPRLGLAWTFMENASLKLLYGEAFRAPNFREMFVANQPAVRGNEDLDPETIRTYEVSLSYKFNKYVTSSINYFYNDIEDLIVLRALPPAQSTSRYENFGDAYIQGIEAETRIDISDEINIFMNYTYQDAQDEEGHNMPFVAKHKGNFGINVKYPKYINTNLSAFFSGKRYREVGDIRDDMPSYALLNLSVIGKKFFKTMEVQGTISNLLDKDYSDPGHTSIPEDLPRAGRTFFIEFSYEF